jgi:hypothetical protein
MPYSRKRALSGTALEMMMPGIEFGPKATVEVFDRMYTEASKLDPETVLLGKVTAGRVMETIDTLLPVVDGERQVTDRLDMDNFMEDQIDRKPAWVMGTIQNDVWMKFDDEMPSFLGVPPKDIWLAVQHMEYVGSYEPVEPAPEMVTVDGQDFSSHGCQVRIHSAAGEPVGELFEMTSTTAVLPQYFARMEDGKMRDLRNENYSIYDPEDEVSEPDDMPEPG